MTARCVTHDEMPAPATRERPGHRCPSERRSRRPGGPAGRRHSRLVRRSRPDRRHGGSARRMPLRGRARARESLQVRARRSALRGGAERAANAAERIPRPDASRGGLHVRDTRQARARRDSRGVELQPVTLGRRRGGRRGLGPGHWRRCRAAPTASRSCRPRRAVVPPRERAVLDALPESGAARRPSSVAGRGRRLSSRPRGRGWRRRWTPSWSRSTRTEPARFLDIEGDPAALSRWTLRDLQPPLGYAGALVVERTVRAVRGGRWSAAEAGT